MFEKTNCSALLIPVLVLCLVCPAFAHKPLLAVDEQGDGTILLEAAFSNGSSISGSKIILRNLKSGKLIKQHTLNQQGMLRFKKPEAEYSITLDAGEGHKITVRGPAPRDHRKNDTRKEQ